MEEQDEKIEQKEEIKPVEEIAKEPQQEPKNLKKYFTPKWLMLYTGMATLVIVPPVTIALVANARHNDSNVEQQMLDSYLNGLTLSAPSNPSNTIEQLDSYLIETSYGNGFEITTQDEVERIKDMLSLIEFSITSFHPEYKVFGKLTASTNQVVGQKVTYTFTLLVSSEGLKSKSKSVTLTSTDNFVAHQTLVENEKTRIEAITNRELPSGTLLENGIAAGNALSEIESLFSFNKAIFAYVVNVAIASDLSYSITISITHRITTSATINTSSIPLTVRASQADIDAVSAEVLRLQTEHPNGLSLPIGDYFDDESKITAISTLLELTDESFTYIISLMSNSSFIVTVMKGGAHEDTIPFAYTIEINNDHREEVQAEVDRIEAITSLELPFGTVIEEGRVTGDSLDSVATLFGFDTSKFQYVVEASIGDNYSILLTVSVTHAISTGITIHTSHILVTVATE